MTSETSGVSSNILVTLEHESLQFWDKNKIFEKSLKKNKGKTPYIFYDGPPFATGLPHHGHLLASTLKDIIPRYMTMQGYYVTRNFGWDCHGLPIEHEINKSLGLHAHEAVEQLGIAGYNQACRAIVMRYRAQWYDVIRRIGRWVDMENDYKTMDVTFMESVWWTFAQLWQKDLVYQGSKIVPYSCALGTVLSNFEAGSNYQNVQDPSIVVQVALTAPLQGYRCELLLWTTTPWTLPANLAVCVHPEEDYVVCAGLRTGVYVVCAAKRLDWVAETAVAEVVAHVLGADLIGLQYTPLYDLAVEDSQAFRIVADNYVSMHTGTGIVHIAPAYGEDDQRIAQAYGLTSLDPLDASGCFTQAVPTLHTLAFKEAESVIIRHLKDTQRLYRHTTLVHSYPMCPRSDTPLMYRAIPSWYIRVTALKERMQAINANIHWVPEHIQSGRFGQWLAHAKDWAVSRNRVWGTPLPLWINDTNFAVICMDSCAMLEQYTGVRVHDLHREHIDHLTFTRAGEAGVYRRVPEVLDCWFESGAMPMAQYHYPFAHPDQPLSTIFPADFIAEGLDQTRGWFYTLTVIACALYDAPAFKNVIVNGIITAEDGKKMSKRLKNYTPPIALMERYGADALRLYMIHSGLVKGEEQRFSDDGVEHMARSGVLPWVHAVKFFDTYATLERWSVLETPSIPEHPLDLWILSASASLVQNIHTAMAQYHLYQVVPAVLAFIDQLTNIYIRMNRPRFWGTQAIGPDMQAFATLYQVLHDCTVCMAPFAPLTSEAMYQRLKVYGATDSPLSVHLHDYPAVQHEHIDTVLESTIQWMQSIITLARQQRNNARIPIKTPLQSITVIHRDPKVLHAIAGVEHLILSELNILSMAYTAAEDDYVSVTLKPNSRILGKRLGPSFKAVFHALQHLSPACIRAAEASGHLNILCETLTADEWHLNCTAKTADVLSDGNISIMLDTHVDAHSRACGMAREIVGYIQKFRKHSKLHVADRICLCVMASAEILEIIQQHLTHICDETLTHHLETQLLPTGSTPENYYAVHDTLYLKLLDNTTYA